MGLKAHPFVGLAEPVWLPDEIAVEIAIVPSGMGNVRSNQGRSASEVTTFTVHETANFAAGANADMHKRWLHGGAGGSYVGFNFVVDDTKIIQLTPLDEVTWAAGTPDGNRTSDHMELCVNADIDHTKARRNAAALTAGVLRARGLPYAKAVQHNVWYGKDCPYLLRREGRWAAFMEQVKGFYSMEIGDAVPEGPTYATPRMIAEVADSPAFVKLGNGANMIRANLVVTATKPTPRLQYASAGSAQIGPAIPANVDFPVDYLIVNADGSQYWYTRWGTRVRFGDTRIKGAS